MPTKRSLSSTQKRGRVVISAEKVEQRRKLASDFWAFVCICSFPAGMIIATIVGVSPLGSLIWGGVASLGAVIVNAVTESKLWIFQPEWRTRFEHPDFMFRLAVITGAILLILHTAIIVMVLTDGVLDRSLLQLIVKRQCFQPSAAFVTLCDTIAK